MDWTILDDADEVAKLACQRIEHASQEAIASRGVFHIVLTGGRTPVNTYRLLTQTNCEWNKWHIWFSDERCLPKNDSERNSVMVEQTLTRGVDIPEVQIHAIPGELGADLAARQYAKLLAEVEVFDLVLLGVGEDGHVASLFPGHTWPSGESVLAIHDSPKPPPERVSLSKEMLSSCRQLLFIITGNEKAAAIRQWRQHLAIPASMVSGREKEEVIIDKAAFDG